MIRIVDAAPPSDRHRPLDDALADLRSSVRPLGNGCGHQVSLAGVAPAWRAMLATHPPRYPGVPSEGEHRMPAAAWEEVLRRLALDLAMALDLAGRIGLADRGPTAADLDQAPLLAQWMPAVEPPHGPLLAGRVEGHPRLGHRWITTSLLINLDPAAGWARTWSRWYRIEERMTRDEIAAARGRALRPTILAIEDDDLTEHLTEVRDQVGAMLRPLEHGR